jgi:hypothetical protein
MEYLSYDNFVDDLSFEQFLEIVEGISHGHASVTNT